MKKHMKLLLTSSLVAFDNTGSAWKLDDNGVVVLSEGNPVYLDSTGAEKVIKIDTIGNLNREAQSHREAKEAAETRLKLFDGLDPAKAREAIEKLSQVDQKKLIDAGEVERVRADISGQFTAQLAERDKAITLLTETNHNMLINQVFDSSEFVRDNVAIPLDFFKNYFRNNFKVEGDKIVAYDNTGNKIASARNVGEYATPEEAMTILIQKHPQKDVILKANVGSGGSGGSGGGSGSLKRTITRSELAKLSPDAQADVFAKIKKEEMVLKDG